MPSRHPVRPAAPTRAVGAALVLVAALSGCSSSSSSTGPAGTSTTATSQDVAAGAAASCSRPEATVTPDVAAPGDEVTVTATGRFDDCDDTGLGITPGPAQGVRVVLWQGGPDVLLALADAQGEDGDVEVVVTVPEDAAEGEAVIAVDPGQSTPNLTIRR